MTTQCPDCGHTFHSSDAVEAQTRISELGTHVRILNSKAASYIDRLADYEEEIQSLRAQCTKLQKEREENISIAPLRSSSPKQENVPQHPPPLPEKDGFAQRQLNRQSLSRLSSFTSYLPGRKRDTSSNELPVPPLKSGLNQSSPNLATPTAEEMRVPFSAPKAQSLTLVGLQSSLETERQLRQQAESTLTQAQSELEELTAQLFGQANEMVAAERKERAKLEERVKLLETKDAKKQQRLERLEKAVERIERVRRMVVEHEKEKGDQAYEMVDVGGPVKIMSMRHMNPQRSRSRRRYDFWDHDEVGLDGQSSVGLGIAVEPDVNDKQGVIDNFEDFNQQRYHEFDVQLKMWRRSKANMWWTPNLDGT